MACGLRRFQFSDVPIFLSSSDRILVEYDSPETQCLNVLRCSFTFKATVTAVWQSWGIMMWKTFRKGLGIDWCHLSSRDFIPAKMPTKIIGINLFCLELYIEIISYLGKWYKYVEHLSEKMYLIKEAMRKNHLIKKTISYTIWQLL